MRFEALREHQVLWAINRVLFHPRGFALGLSYPDDVSREDIMAHKVEPIGWVLLGDGSESWHYAESVDEDSALRTFEAFLDSQRVEEITHRCPSPGSDTMPLSGGGGR